ncbi:MAG: hypothetical protein WDK95_16340 [Syntrophorhabdaceae bacterium]
MLVLERKGLKVFHNGVELKINAQASKGPNNEVVWVGDLDEANGQKWVSLSRLNEGINEIVAKGRNVAKSKKYELTPQEAEEVALLQGKIDSIIEVAKARYVPKPNLNVNVDELSEEEKDELVAQLQNYLNVKKATK